MFLGNYPDPTVVLMLDGDGNGYYHTNPAGEEFEVGDQFEFMDTIYLVTTWPTGEFVAISEINLQDDPFEEAHVFRIDD